ncbi:TspO/MBR family protein [Caproicibacterium sp. NSD3]
MKSKTLYIRWKPLVISLLISIGTGAVSGFLTQSNTFIFQNIKKPPLAPPGALFPVVWTVLYILMGISSYLIYTSDCEDKSRALWIYGIQLAINFFWTIIFFNLRNYLFAFIWLLLLWVSVLFMMTEFRKINKLAAQLQIPYFIWITFAAYLSAGIWLLNR